MAKLTDYDILISTKLSGEFVFAGESIKLDPSVKATKDFLEKGIIRKTGEVAVVIDPNVELKEELAKVNLTNSELLLKIEELETKDL